MMGPVRCVPCAAPEARAQRRYPVVEASGSYREIGEHMGRAASAQIRALVDMYADDDAKPGAPPVSVEVALAAARAECPHLVEEIEGMAAGAGVSVASLLRLNGGGASMPWQGAEEGEGGCTSLARVEPGRSVSFLGQNWDNEPRVDPYTVVTIRRPTDAPATMCVGRAGLIGYIGFSSSGFGILLNALRGEGASGLPLYFNVRRILESTTLPVAVATLRASQRDRPNNLTIVSPEGAAHLEVTCESVGVVRPEGGEGELAELRSGTVLHTNHYLEPGLQHINAKFPEIIQSRSALLPRWSCAWFLTA